MPVNVNVFGASIRLQDRFSRGLRVARSEVNRFAGTARRSERDVHKFAVSVDDADQSITKLGRSSEKSRLSLNRFNKVMQAFGHMTRLFRSFWRVVKIPALIAGIGLLGQGLSGLVAGFTAVTGAVGPAVGALAVLPSLLGTLGQAAGVLALTQLKDVTDALGGNKEALKRLTPEAKKFIGVLRKDGMPVFKELRRMAQGKVFAGLATGLQAFLNPRTVRMLRTVVGGTADVMGSLSAKAGTALGSKDWTRDLTKLGTTNTETLNRMGLSAGNLATALRDIMIAATPLTRWFTAGLFRASKALRSLTAEGRRSGALTKFFQSSARELGSLGAILSDVARGFYNIFKAAAPFGQAIQRDLGKAVDAWADWTGSVKGQNEIRAYFKDSMPLVYEFGRTVRDVTKAFFDLGRQPGASDFLHTLRVDVLPAIVTLLETTTRDFAPAVGKALPPIADLITKMAAAAGPLTVAVKAFTKLIEGVNILLSIPGTVPILTGLATFFGVAKGAKMTGAIIGIGGIGKAIRKLPSLAKALAIGGLVTRFRTIADIIRTGGLLTFVKTLGRNRAGSAGGIAKAASRAAKAAGATPVWIMGPPTVLAGGLGGGAAGPAGKAGKLPGILGKAIPAAGGILSGAAAGGGLAGAAVAGGAVLGTVGIGLGATLLMDKYFGGHKTPAEREADQRRSMQMIKDSINKAKPEIKKTGTETVTAFTAGVKASATTVKQTGAQIPSWFAMGLTGAATPVVGGAATAMGDAPSATAGSTGSTAYQAGYSFGQRAIGQFGSGYSSGAAGLGMGAFGYAGLGGGGAAGGGLGGNWAGTQPLATQWAGMSGLAFGSQKRATKLTASGNISDHWLGNNKAYAVDLPVSGAAGDPIAARMAAAAGGTWTPGEWMNVTRDGYRYQLGWRVPGHFDHIHAGVKKLHGGGTFRAPSAGGEGMAILRDRERVVPASGARGGGGGARVNFSGPIVGQVILTGQPDGGYHAFVNRLAQDIQAAINNLSYAPPA